MDRSIITGFTYPTGHKISQAQLTSRHGVKDIINYKGFPKGFHLEFQEGRIYIRVELKTYCPDEIDFYIPVLNKNFEGAFWDAMTELVKHVFLTSGEIAALTIRRHAFVAYCRERQAKRKRAN